MEEIFLEVDPRQELGRGKVKDLREQGFIPGVVYSGGKESVSVKIARRQFLQLLHEHRLENMIITIKVKGDSKEKGRPCMIKEMQQDPVHEHILHIDFAEISLTKAIKVNVPVVTKGESIGVKQEGGSLEHILWEIEVECLPARIPQNIEIDISKLKIGDSVHIKDITFPPEVKVLNEQDAIVLTVSAPMKVEEPVEGAEGDEKKEPEVIKEKKEVPEEGETKK
ncbi:MAG: 50S ribosomal protein L25 [Candidatus Omnitrophica bacterium]|nr:50S ribosomal protein L25 [Candidatus Omnitrophota bacterium]